MPTKFHLRYVQGLMAALLVAGGWCVAPRASAQPLERSLEIEASDIILSGVETDVDIRLVGEGWPERGRIRLYAEGQLLRDSEVSFSTSEDNPPSITVEGLTLPTGTQSLAAELDGIRSESSVRMLPAWLSILPPLLAILLAIMIREVLVALFAGLWLGATFIHDYNPFLGLLRSVDHYAVNAFADADHAKIIIFSLLLGGMIGIIARSGGAQGLAQIVTRVAKDRMRGALSTWLMGLAIFFDDYSNSLLVGSTMRPITDRLRISREKLAFLVDATAAPVSSFAIISSWVGVEVGYIAEQYAARGIEGDPYLVFLETIPYRFYPILMLVFGLMLILQRRDFGAMWHAEYRAVSKGQVSRPGAALSSDFEAEELQPPEGVKPHWRNAVIPILVVILTAMAGMMHTGHEALLEVRAAAESAHTTALQAVEVAQDADASALVAAQAQLDSAERALGLTEINLRNVFGKADSLQSLLWAAFLGGLVAFLMALLQRCLSLREGIDAWLGGLKSVSLAMMILVLAWSLGTICSDLHTASFVISALGEWLPVSFLPATIFVVSAAVSFATGTSWGTMGILFPLVIPLAHELSAGDEALILGAVASILSGSVWGDHCSPISDTTIMSSMASSCDHVDHVRTQIPYALAVGLVSLVLGDVATGLGLYSPWVGLLLGSLALALIIRFLGKPVKPPTAPLTETNFSQGSATTSS